jgi:hypothetical protein
MTTALANPLAWNPGLDNAYRSLGSIYQSMPGDVASAIPWYVRLLEHPSSPLALGGAVDLRGHDCVHILLGRGLLQQDEAFVLGFTMGRSGLRAALGIEPEQLRSIYAVEAERWPHGVASARLRAAHGSASGSRATELALPQPRDDARHGGAEVAAVGREG